MSGVIDGQAVSAAITNPAFINKNGDDIMPNKLGFSRALSGATITDIQADVNKIFTASGVSESATGTVYSAPTGTITDGDPYQTALSKIAVKFDPSTGHEHTGSNGDGPPIAAASIATVPFTGIFQQGTRLTSVTGGTTTVSTQMAGKLVSTGQTVLGVVTNASFNRVILRNTSGGEFVDGSGNVVYGRITNSGGPSGTWTLTYFSLVSGTETAFSFSGSNTVDWYYQQLYNPLNSTWPTYDTGAFVPSDTATADVLDASATQRGVVNTTSQTISGAKTFSTSVSSPLVKITGSSSGTLTMQGAATITNYTITWPAAVAGAGQVLTDAAGNGILSWTTITGFTNPMTTLGDIMYEDATPQAARLAGNTTTTKKFLTQTGTGSISAVPAWSTIVSGDVPTTLTGARVFSTSVSSPLHLITGGTSGTITMQGPSVITDYSITWPAAQGGAGSVPQNDGSGNLTWVAPPSGTKNYLTTYLGNAGNGNFEFGNTNGWALGTVTLTNNFPSGVPTFGSGASGNLSISAVSSGQLAGSFSLSYASSAATVAGNFVASNAFTIDIEDQAKVLIFKFAYKAQSNPANGNWSGTSSNSFAVAIYDVTNAVFIQPSSVFGMVQSSGVGICNGTFQTSANGTSYRILVYNANASTGAITVYFDDFVVGPQSASPSPNLGFQAYSASNQSITNSSNTTVNLDTISFDNAGSFNTSTHQYTIPISGTWVFSAELQFDLSSVNLRQVSLIVNGSVVAIGETAGGASFNPRPSVTYVNKFNAGDTISIKAFQNSGGALNIIGGTGPTASFLQGFLVSATVANTDSRVVAFKATSSSNTAPGANSPIIFNSVNYDTHAGYNSGTGQYTIPISGFYKLTAGLQTTSGTTAVQYRKNGSSVAYFGTAAGNNSTGSLTDQFVAGDIITVTMDTAVTLAATQTALEIERVSGPSVPDAVEEVNMSYTSTNTPAVTGTPGAIAFNTKSFDSHNEYSGSTYTVPVAGKYLVCCTLTLGATTASSLEILLNKNGSFAAELNEAFVTTAVANLRVSGTCFVQCNAGDTLQLIATANNSNSLFGTSGYSHLDIVKVG